MFKHVSCQCPFKREFEANANANVIGYFSLEPVHLELLIHLCPLSLKFLFKYVFHGTWIWPGFTEDCFCILD